ncbi:MAG: NAD(P)H-dependent oxidoreductase subunit E [Anaerolineae bacterium]|nr:NAD(P)H-dependent oxidoreductase subunit E [Anaerolineae bacterium]
MPTPSIDLSDLAPVIQSHAQKGRTALLPALYSVQDTIGYIPPEAVQFISDQFNLPPEEINQVVRSFPLFFSEPVSKTVIHVCNNPVCANAGADAVMKRFSLAVEERRAAGEPVGALTIEFAPCLGLCEHAPAMIVQGTSVARADSLSYEDIVAGQLRHPRSIVRNEIAILTANCGKNRVNNIMLYQAGGGYQALKKAIAAGPQFVLDEVKASGLVGRGGAAYPAWKKWSTVAESGASDKYVICNADEAEPGSFKDRVLLEDEPHLILEGLILAGFATGAAKGFIYIRGEYIFQYRVMIKAIEEARAAGFIGEHILGSAFSFEVEVRRGAGTYVAGEETAQIKALEGKPAIPHAKPPYPSISGLYGAPTVVNNVETLANVPYILRAGSTAYRKIGTDASSGTTSRTVIRARSGA